MDEMDKFSAETKAAIFRSGDEIIDSEYGWGVIQSGNDIDGYMVGFGDILAPDEFPVHELLRGVKCLSLNDALGNALLEGDYAGIRKMFEELKAERDELKAMLVRSEERAAALSDQPSAPEWKDRALKAERDLDDLQHDVGVFAECGLSMSKDDKESLRSDDSISFMETWQQEHDKLLNTEFYLRETTRLLEKHIRQTVYWVSKFKQRRSLISGLEDTAVDLGKLVEKRNRQVRYWMGVVGVQKAQLMAANEWIGFRERMVAHQRQEHSHET